MTSLLLVCATMTFAAWLVAAHRRLVTHLARRFVALPRLQQVVLVLAVGVMTVCAQKSDMSRRAAECAEGGANVVLNVENGDLRTETRSSSQTSAISSVSVLRAKTSLSTNDLARGFALTRVGVNEVFDFSAPAGANYATNWMLHGGATARTRLHFDDWTFMFGDGCLTNLTAFMFGVIAPDLYNEEKRISPLQASLGFIAGGFGFVNAEILENGRRGEDGDIQSGSGVSPLQNEDDTSSNNVEAVSRPLQEEEGNILSRSGQETASTLVTTSNLRDSVSPCETKSGFWSFLTPSNSLVITWQNVLLHRLPENPVSFQVEFFANGDFTYRYDFSRLPADDVLTNAYVIAAPGVGEPFVLSRDEPLEGECLSPTLDRNLTSLTFRRLEAGDQPNADRDGDGLTTEEELFVYGTDLGLSDTSGDGITDGEAVAQGLDPLARNATDADILARVAASATNAAFASATTIAEGSLASWTLFDGFAANVAAGTTNVLWERTFAVNRTSAWQQIFVSSEKDAAGAWMLEGLRFEWEASDGSSGSLARSPVGDSFRIPLSTNEVSTIALRLRATGVAYVRSVPLYLLSYEPTFQVAGAQKITGESGATFYVLTNGANAALQITADESRRPHRAAIGDDERDWSSAEAMGEDFSLVDDGVSASVSVPRPGIYSLPTSKASAQFASPRRAMRRAATKNGTSENGNDGGIVVLDPSVGWNCSGHGCWHDGLSYDWSENVYVEEKDYPLDTKCLRKKWYRSWDGGWLTDDCTLWVNSGAGVNGVVTTEVDADNVGHIYVDGVEVWKGTTPHAYGAWECWAVIESLDDECDSCDSDCSSGNCDSLEGSSLGSLRFRIPLGSPGKGLVAGFAWFASDDPVTISRSLFQVKAHPSATISDTTASGVRHIVCSDAQGRDLAIEDIANGVRVTIRTTRDQALEHTWEILNVDGDSSRVRLKKISRRDNVMSDETYAYADGKWTRTDSIAMTATRLETWDDLASGGTKVETRTTTDAAGQTLSQVTTTQTRIGSCDNAVLRETRREESTGRETRITEATYWDDPQTQRHGKLKLLTSNARAWEYHDYDGDGRETLRVTQRNGAAVPSALMSSSANALSNYRSLGDAFVTEYDYTPSSGDDNNVDDYNRPRTEARYVVRNGEMTLIGRTRHRYTRFAMNGYDCVKCETWRTVNTRMTTGGAYSYEITFADSDGDTPRLMRGEVVEALDENGVKTTNAYSMNGNVLVCETRKSYGAGESQFPTCETKETEGTQGTVLRHTTRLTSNGAIIADEHSTYDEKRRLRSTTYLDGTSLTNAYSCCRLLWSVDREGRKTLRSAETGTDHLYYADEDVWLADASTNGAYRVTQHFFDALGRETNTVVSVGSTPSEAASSTRYPYGGSDYLISTDVRGAETIRRVDLIDNGDETCEAIFTNGVEVSRTKSRSIFGGATSTRREWSRSNWTEQTRCSDYDALGCRIEYAIAMSSDYGVVTNSVSTYDPLGRVVSTATPLGTTAYSYGGLTSRISQSVFTAGDVRRVTAYLYNERGELVGTTTDGVTSRSDVAYETDASNISWRVTTNVKVTGAVTNNVRMAKTQLNGLSDDLRSRQIETSASGRTTQTETRFDSETQTLTTTAQTEDQTPVVLTSKFGLQLREASLEGVAEYAYDALGRVASETQLNAQGEVLQSVLNEYSSADDLVRETVDYGEDGVGVWTTEHDQLGHATVEGNALGEVVCIESDALGRTVAKRGDTYPLRFCYDTQGRKTNGLTTRDDGATWDETRWEFDAASGLNTTKVYADGSRIAYAYAADGKKTRTTWSRGAWKENVYNARRLVSGTTYSDETPSVAYEYDAAGKMASAALSNGDEYAYQRDMRLLVTNETVRIASNDFAIARTYDSFHRAQETTVVSGGVRYASETRLYDSENRVCGYALTNAAGKGVSVALAYDGSLLMNKTFTLPNGKTFTESLTRNASRRELITRRAYSFDGRSIYQYSTGYDILGRPTNAVDSISSARAWIYNRRTELVAATLGTNSFNYAYDTIGNRLTATLNASTNTYSANNLNQYTSIFCDSAALREAKTPTYDADGNLISDGTFSCAYDAESRLVSALPLSPANGSFAIENRYDHRHRRTQKVVSRFSDGEWSAYSTHTYVWDGNNIVHERIVFADGSERVCEYFWGLDKSGTEQNAGGVGGLLAVSIDGAFYLPCYDHNGNIVAYVSESGDLAAQFVYDPYGNVIEQYGIHASQFTFGFSTKIHDREVGLAFYQRRFYSPDLGRWLNRDPIEEDGGENLYAFCLNAPISVFDKVGTDIWVESTTAVYGFHQRVCVTAWVRDVGGKHCCNGTRYRKAGKTCISFGVAQGRDADIMDSFSGDGGSFDSDSSGDSSTSVDEAGNVKGKSAFPNGFDGPNQDGDGQVYRDDRDPSTSIAFSLSTGDDPCSDIDIRNYMDGLVGQNANYSLMFQNCRSFSQAVFNKYKRRKSK